MKVILLKDVEKVGGAGDGVDVKDGFGRNFLLTRGLAVEAGKKKIKFLENEKRKLASRQKRMAEEAREFAEKLRNISCTIAMPAGEGDRLYGEVTPEIIADFYKREGIDMVDKRRIHLEKPIRHLGVYQADIKLHPEVAANVKVWVVKK